MSKYEFFWHGPFSQWYMSSFTLFENKFNCAEQWMMFNKALVFGDNELAEDIYRSDDPKKQKDMGRKVKNFVPHIWHDMSHPLVYAGNIAKFSQNTNLKDLLLNTGDTVLVEASPYDNIWGIGFKAEDAERNIDSWGENRLGKILMEVRNTLR